MTTNPLNDRKPATGRVNREDLEDMALSLNAERFSIGNGWCWYVFTDEKGTRLRRKEGEAPPHVPSELVGAARERLITKFNLKPSLSG